MGQLPDDIKSQESEIIKAAEAELKDPARRRLLGNVLTLGGLSLLTGVTLFHGETINDLLKRVSRFNDGAQGFLFNPNDLAPTYKASDIKDPFPFNAFYHLDALEAKAGSVEADTFRLKLSGLIANKQAWSLNDLNALPQVTQITRHICIEGWSAIGQWGGVRFSDFLQRIDADTTAKYVGFVCSDGYFTSIDMATALHAQTQLTLRFKDQVLPLKFGFPMKIRMPTKLGYKNPKHVIEIFVSNTYSGGFWENQGYNWFGGS